MSQNLFDFINMSAGQSIKYIALLRGINVGGHTVKMDILRKLFGDLGFDGVRSYIQSGNIFFLSDEDNQQLLRERIEKYLLKQLRYEVTVYLRTQEEMENLLSLDPFKHISAAPDIRLAVTFLPEKMENPFPVPYRTKDGGYEVISATDQEVFVVWHLQNGRLGKEYNFIDKMLHIETTTRFWHTAGKILDAAKKE